MNCETTLLLMNAVLDGELTSAERAELDRHLEECPTCREALSDLQNLDEALARALRPVSLEPVVSKILNAIDEPAMRQAKRTGHSAELTETIARVRSRGDGPPVTSRRTATGTMVLVLGTLAVAAVVILRLPDAAPAVAEITLATGSIDVQSSNSSKWTSVDGPSGVVLAAHSRIRTRNDSLCEIRTKSDTLVRLNSETEVVVHQPRQLELISGEFWCRTPTTTSVEISVPKNVRKPRSETTFTCPSSCETQWQTTADDQLRCTSVSASPIELKVSTGMKTSPRLRG